MSLYRRRISGGNASSTVNAPPSNTAPVQPTPLVQESPGNFNTLATTSQDATHKSIPPLPQAPPPLIALTTVKETKPTACPSNTSASVPVGVPRSNLYRRRHSSLAPSIPQALGCSTASTITLHPSSNNTPTSTLVASSSSLVHPLHNPQLANTRSLSPHHAVPAPAPPSAPPPAPAVVSTLPSRPSLYARRRARLPPPSTGAASSVTHATALSTAPTCFATYTPTPTPTPGLAANVPQPNLHVAPSAPTAPVSSQSSGSGANARPASPPAPAPAPLPAEVYVPTTGISAHPPTHTTVPQLFAPFAPAPQSSLFAARVNAIATAIRTAGQRHPNVPARGFLAGLAHLCQSGDGARGLAAVTASDVVRLVEQRVEERVARQMRAQARKEGVAGTLPAAVCVSGAPMSLLLAERERALRVAELAAEDVAWVAEALSHTLGAWGNAAGAEPGQSEREEAQHRSAKAGDADQTLPPAHPLATAPTALQTHTDAHAHTPARTRHAARMQLRVTPTHSVHLTPRVARHRLYRVLSLSLVSSPESEAEDAAAGGDAGAAEAKELRTGAMVAALDRHLAQVQQEAAAVAEVVSACTSAEAVVQALSQDDTTSTPPCAEPDVPVDVLEAWQSGPRRQLLAELQSVAGDAETACASAQEPPLATIDDGDDIVDTFFGMPRAHSPARTPNGGAPASAAPPSPPAQLYLEELFPVEHQLARGHSASSPPPLLWVPGVSGSPDGALHQRLRERGAPPLPSTPDDVRAPTTGPVGGVPGAVASDAPTAAEETPPTPVPPPTDLPEDALVRIVSQPRVIHGFTVHFPADRPPYPTQLAYCARLLAAFNSRSNALLESPTGTGKSVSMLASAIAFVVRERPAWERQYGHLRANKAREAEPTPGDDSDEEFAMRARERGTFDLFGTRRAQVTRKRRAEWASKAQHAQRRALPRLAADTGASAGGEWLVLGDGQQHDTHAHVQPPHTGSAPASGQPPQSTRTAARSKRSGGVAADAEEQCAAVKNWGLRWRSAQQEHPPPRVIVASRTHTQLAQLGDTLRELPRPPMVTATTLASRKLLCTHPLAPKGTNTLEVPGQKQRTKAARLNFASTLHGGGAVTVEEFCKAALEREACAQRSRIHKVGCARGSEEGVWDVEELLSQANKHKACAYFASRALMEKASIVFVPYSYLLDPHMQKSSGIADALPNAVVCFDEGHNVSSAACETFSFTAPLALLLRACDWLYVCAEHGPHEQLHLALAQITHMLLAVVLRKRRQERAGLRSGYAPIIPGALGQELFGNHCHGWRGEEWLWLARSAGLSGSALEQCVKLAGVVLSLHREPLDLQPANPAMRQRKHVPPLLRPAASSAVAPPVDSYAAAAESTTGGAGGLSLDDMWQASSGAPVDVSCGVPTTPHMHAHAHEHEHAHSHMSVQRRVEAAFRESQRVAASLFEANPEMGDPRAALYSSNAHHATVTQPRPAPTASEAPSAGSDAAETGGRGKREQAKDRRERARAVRKHAPLPVQLRMPGPLATALQTLFRALAAVAQETWARKQLPAKTDGEEAADGGESTESTTVNDAKEAPLADSTSPSSPSCPRASGSSASYEFLFSQLSQEDLPARIDVITDGVQTPTLLDALGAGHRSLLDEDGQGTYTSLWDSDDEDGPSISPADTGARVAVGLEAHARTNALRVDEVTAADVGVQKGPLLRDAYVCHARNAEHYRVLLQFPEDDARDGRRGGGSEEGVGTAEEHLRSYVAAVSEPSGELLPMGVLWTELAEATLSFLCMSPALAMLTLAPARSIVLTSATLAPLPALESELGLPFPITLQAAHVVPPNNVSAHVVTHCDTRVTPHALLPTSPHALAAMPPAPAIPLVQLSSAFTNRSSSAYLDALGRTLLSSALATPGGTLVFFPSRSLLDSAWAHWQQSGLAPALLRARRVFLEPGGDDGPGRRRLGESGGEVECGYAQPGADCTTFPHLWTHARALSRDPVPVRSARTPAFADECTRTLALTPHRGRAVRTLCDVCVLLCAAQQNVAVGAALARVQALVRTGGPVAAAGDWWDAWYASFTLTKELANACTCGMQPRTNTPARVPPVLPPAKHQEKRLLQVPPREGGRGGRQPWRGKGYRAKGRDTLVARGGQIQLGHTIFKPQQWSQKEKNDPAALVARLMDEYRAANNAAKVLQMRRLARTNPLLALGIAAEGPMACLDALQHVFPALQHARMEPTFPEDVRGCLRGRTPPASAVPAPAPLAEGWGVWLGVCRGRTSEGVDLRDHDARTVLVVGMPLAGWKDRAVRVKWAYNDERRALRRAASSIAPADENAEWQSSAVVAPCVSGEEQYLSSAMQAINQAAGRAVRHAKDYGALVLIDNRLTRKREADSLSKWIYDSVERNIAFKTAYGLTHGATDPASTSAQTTACAVGMFHSWKSWQMVEGWMSQPKGEDSPVALKNGTKAMGSHVDTTVKKTCDFPRQKEFW